MRLLLLPLTIALSTPWLAAQPFRLIHAWESTADYLEKIQSAPESEWEALYEQTAVTPFEGPCVARGRSFTIAPVSTPPEDLRRWLTALWEAKVDDIVQQALARAAGALPGPATNVCIYLADPASPVQYMQGVGGFALGASRTIVLFINPMQGWAERLPYVTAHEYHHVAALSRYSGRYRRTALFTLTLEGRADAFASRLYPGVFAPWTRGATPAQELRIWEEIQPLLDLTDSNFQWRYMIGDGQSVPYWSGYTIGAHLVEAFLKRQPELTIEQWTRLPPETILTKSGYAGVRTN